MSQHPEPLIINLTPTGMVPTKRMTPHVPVTCDEILADVRACAALGASIVHVHARDEHEVPTHRPEAFAPIVEGIRQIDPELIVCVTCSGRNVSELEQRAEVLSLTGDAKPDMASLTLGSNNFFQQASVNSPDVVRGLAERMKQNGIKPELEAFEPGMVDFGKHLVKQGLIDEPCYVNILLGNLGTSPLSPGSLAAFLNLIPDTWTWAVGGIGRFQLDANTLAIAAGGHVRIGLEDNIYFDRERKDLATNPRLVERIVRLAELNQRSIATPRSVREKLGLAIP
jgi:uncharacterized protein (DUF849 family)